MPKIQPHKLSYDTTKLQDDFDFVLSYLHFAKIGDRVQQFGCGMVLLLGAVAIAVQNGYIIFISIVSYIILSSFFDEKYKNGYKAKKKKASLFQFLESIFDPDKNNNYRSGSYDEYAACVAFCQNNLDELEKLGCVYSQEVLESCLLKISQRINKDKSIESKIATLDAIKQTWLYKKRINYKNEYYWELYGNLIDGCMSDKENYASTYDSAVDAHYYYRFKRLISSSTMSLNTGRTKTKKPKGQLELKPLDKLLSPIKDSDKLITKPRPSTKPETKGKIDTIEKEKPRLGKKHFKIDWLDLQKKKREIGFIGEEIAMQIEKSKLAGHPYLNKSIAQVSKVSDREGYDIQSYDITGKQIFIEVKTTNSSNKNEPFYMSSNELRVLNSYPSQYFIYRIYNLNVPESKYEIIQYSAKDVLGFTHTPQSFIVSF